MEIRQYVDNETGVSGFRFQVSGLRLRGPHFTTLTKSLNRNESSLVERKPRGKMLFGGRGMSTHDCSQRGVYSLNLP